MLTQCSGGGLSAAANSTQRIVVITNKEAEIVAAMAGAAGAIPPAL